MRRRFLLAASAALALAIPTIAPAREGAIEINQARALAGGVTSGDAPGFPVDLYTPGSYVLTSNLASNDPNQVVIWVRASDVDIDLNGFVVRDGFYGVYGPSTSQRITVRNGTVRNNSQVGVFLFGRDARVEDVRALQHGFSGISIESGEVTRCIAIGNGSGILLTEGSVSESLAVGNSNQGISHFSALGTRGVFDENVALSNAGGGLRGSDLSVVGNVAAGNGFNNIVLFLNSSFQNTSGRSHNLASGTGVSGGISMGPNVCNGVAC